MMGYVGTRTPNHVLAYNDASLRVYGIGGERYCGAVDEINWHGAQYGIDRVLQRVLAAPGVVDADFKLASVDFSVTGGPVPVIKRVYVGYDPDADLAVIDEAMRKALQDYMDLCKLPLHFCGDVPPTEQLAGLTPRSQSERLPCAGLRPWQYDPDTDPAISNLRRLFARVPRHSPPMGTESAEERKNQEAVNAELYRLWKSGYRQYQLDAAMGRPQAHFRIRRHRILIGELSR